MENHRKMVIVPSGLKTMAMENIGTPPRKMENHRKIVIIPSGLKTMAMENIGKSRRKMENQTEMVIIPSCSKTMAMANHIFWTHRKISGIQRNMVMRPSGKRLQNDGKSQSFNRKTHYTWPCSIANH